MNQDIIDWNGLNAEQKTNCLQRARSLQSKELVERTAEIISAVRDQGDAAVLDFTAQFDGVRNTALTAVSTHEAEKGVSQELLDAIADAGQRIRDFQMQAKPSDFTLDTAPGVRCSLHYRSLETVGLYVPGGSAPLLSSVLMQAIPARVAGCENIVLASPPDSNGVIHPAILAAANYCGVDEVVPMGGVQAIAAMAYGTDSVSRCDKLFGPGNAWVTEAKRQVSTDPDGAAIDMPAGPSEVMVIADESADPEFVALDLLSQAEHGPDSQAILLSNADSLFAPVIRQLERYASQLNRSDILRQSMTLMRLIRVESIDQAIEVANQYASEHLILNVADAQMLVDQVRHAGSIFVGAWTPESLGDYCSGTNHVLPTSGYARSYSGLSVTDFMKRISVQSATREGLMHIGPTAELMARTESLQAHELAVAMRRLRIEESTPS